ncbi:MAG: ATP-grasp domain-containing protein [Isosphaeraceae bacterium]
MTQPRRLIILGASTRAAAMSARRAGWLPGCIDLFGDRDLAALGPLVRAGAEGWEAAFDTLAARLGEIPWLYTGPAENYPEIVQRIAARHRLLGNPADILRSARNPRLVAELLRRAGLPHADVRMDDAALPLDGSWLAKPIASVGGRLIGPLTAGAARLEEPCYFQRFISGDSYSALGLAEGGRARLLGVTRQLHGGPAGRFAYRGNLGPIVAGPSLESSLQRILNALARGFGLVGLFGVDYILHDGEPWVVEVNPRYTAAVEVLELAGRRSLLREHLDACSALPKGGTTDPSSAASGQTLQAVDGPNGRVVGKLILYAERGLIAPEIGLLTYSDENPYAVPDVADVPWPGATFSRGEPIMTILAEGTGEDDCVGRLVERASRWQDAIRVWNRQEESPADA